MLIKIDLWLLAQVARGMRYLGRYFTKPGGHRSLGASTAQQIQASRVSR
jgi:hypothetical protein